MSDQFKKQITLFSLTMIAIGSSIGSGIFSTPGGIAKSVHTEGWTLMVWVLGGLVSLCGALTFAELASLFPRAGGFYVFLKEAFGELTAFLYGWSMLLVINTGSLAALSLVFSSYLSGLIPMSDATQLSVSIGAIVLLTIMNVLGVKIGGLFASIFTVAKLLGIAIVVFIGFAYGTEAPQYFDFSWAKNNETSLISAVGLALIGVTFSYGGYQHATFIAAEVKDAPRIVPRAMMLGIAVVCIAYLTINVAYMKLMPIGNVANSNKVASDAVSLVWSAGAKFISFTIVLSVLGTIGIYILTAPRIYFAMADDGLFFKFISKIHPTYKTPQYAIILQSVWTIVLLIFWKTFNDLISYVVFVDALFFFLAALALFVFRNKIPNAPRNYRTWGFPVTPIIFMAIEGFIVVNTLVEKPDQARAGLIFLGLGAIMYFYFKKKKS